MPPSATTNISPNCSLHSCQSAAGSTAHNRFAVFSVSAYFVLKLDLENFLIFLFLFHFKHGNPVGFESKFRVSDELGPLAAGRHECVHTVIIALFFSSAHSHKKKQRRRNSAYERLGGGGKRYIWLYEEE